MTSPKVQEERPAEARTLLLVEDNPGDSALVVEQLEQLEQLELQDQEAPSHTFTVLCVRTMREASDVLKTSRVDVILLDLNLPDASGTDTVTSVSGIAEDVPILVLTGSDDETLGLKCIRAGAQDFLCKRDLRASVLRRAIGYALTRVREAQLRELQATLSQLRELSSRSSKTSLTAALVGLGPMSTRSPAVFQQLVDLYVKALESFVELHRPQASLRAMKERVITHLGDAAGGPRDLLDVHVAALDAMALGEGGAPQTSALEGRLLALEMMGLLVDYYRVGLRRRFQERTV